MPYTLLLADDSVTIQRVIELTFADEDIRVVAVGDGDQAIAAIDQTPPDIVLADVGMPGRDGYEVALHIRTTPRLAHIPVLLLTGAFEPIDQARVAEVQCDGVLAKPFEPQLVIGRVKELLARPREITPTDRVVAPPPVAAPWTAVLDEPGVPGAGAAVAVTDVDRYFDRLDQAFANLANSERDTTKPAAPPVADPTDWFTTTAPAKDAAATSALAETAHQPLDPAPALAHVPSAPVAPPPAPPLADMFVALLAAEQTVPPPPPEQWPVLPATPAEPTVSEAVVEDIVRRVLEKLSDRVVRETVADIVSDVAERLVRDEIEAIKKKS